MKKYRTIAVDFDGCLCENKFPGVGEPKMEVIEFIRKAHDAGHKIIIWTCRMDAYLYDAIRFLKQWKVPYDRINENYDYEKFKCRKIVADIYLDDRSLNVDDLEGFNLDTMDFDNSEVIDDIETLLNSVVKGVTECELDNWETIDSIANKYGFFIDEELNVSKEDK